jgi:beta-N-acetylhexosaminidase
VHDSARLVLVNLEQPALDSETVAHLRRYKPGGVVLFKHQLPDLETARALSADLREILGEDVLLAVDQEGGNVWRTPFLPSAPSAGNLGSSNDADLTRRVGVQTGAGMRAFGANWCFAPVLDINVNPDNPVIAERSFGDNAERVARLGRAWLEGIQSTGVAACAKHFPGHGDTRVDSHHDLPSVDKSRNELERLEFAPFRAVLDSVASLMTAHIVFPALDPDLPATLSKRILTDLVRDAWKYQGLIVTDAMDMGAITRRWGRGDAAVQSVSAGADILEVFGNLTTQAETFAALERASTQGTLSKARLNDALERRTRLAGAYPSITTDLPLEPDLMRAAWQRGIARHGAVRLPARGARVAVVLERDNPGGSAWDSAPGGTAIQEALRRVYAVTPVFLEEAATLPVIRSSMDAVVLVTSSPRRPQHDWDTLGPDLHLALWNPYIVHDIRAPALCTYGLTTESLEALVDVLNTGNLESLPTV